MINEENKLFFVGLKAFIEKDGSLLIVRQSDNFTDTGKWELPGGRISPSEVEASLQSVLLREVHEECGDIEVSMGDIVCVFRRQFPSGEWVFLVGYDCQYVSGDIKLSDEHTEYAWITRTDMDQYEFASGYKEAIETYFSKKSRTL